MGCPECAALKVEIAELNRALDGAVWVRDDDAAKVARGLGLSPQQGQIVYLLYKAGTPLTARQLTEGLDPIGSVKDRYDMDYATVVICVARKRLPTGSIVSRHGRAGYSLSPVLRTKVKELLI